MQPKLLLLALLTFVTCELIPEHEPEGLVPEEGEVMAEPPVSAGQVSTAPRIRRAERIMDCTSTEECCIKHFQPWFDEATAELGPDDPKPMIVSTGADKMDFSSAMFYCDDDRLPEFRQPGEATEPVGPYTFTCPETQEISIKVVEEPGLPARSKATCVDIHPPSLGLSWMKISADAQQLCRYAPPVVKGRVPVAEIRAIDDVVPLVHLQWISYQGTPKSRVYRDVTSTMLEEAIEGWSYAACIEISPEAGDFYFGIGLVSL